MSQKQQIVLKLLAAVYLLGTACIAQASRSPANYAPDDDLIVVPVVVEESAYRDFNLKYKDQFQRSRQKMDLWLQQEQWAQDYGLEDTGFINLPTRDEKEQFFRRNYLRFISKDIKESNRETLRDTWKSWSTDDEIDSIEERDQREDYLVKATRNRGIKGQELETRIKVGKRKFKLRFRPRVEMGMMKVTLQSSFIDVDAWVGINGNQEVKISKKWESTGTRGLLYYYIDQKRSLASVDQTIKGNLHLRFTHEKDLYGFSQFFNGGSAEVNSLQVRFNMGF